jgi:hypothetical protein
MVFVKASPESEAEVMPDPQMIEAMTAYNEELHRAGVLLMAEGLKPSKYGARINFKASGETEVVDGPFTETKELVAGFWILQCSSLQECVEWMKRCPNPHKQGGEIEIRQIYELGDFPLDDENQKRFDGLKAQLAPKA